MFAAAQKTTNSATNVTVRDETVTPHHHLTDTRGVKRALDYTGAMLRPVWIPSDAPPWFPSPQDYNKEGLIAGGGDLSTSRLLAAYKAGLFPWYNEPPILWWSPDPRSIITPQSLHVSRSLRRTMSKPGWKITAGQALNSVMLACADREEGTWLTKEMQVAYLDLESAGHVLSYEVWWNDELVGGLYGVLIGGLYAAESKFHRRTDASKIALCAAVTDLYDRGVQLFDVQFSTPHLASLGVFEVSRDEYLERLAHAQSALLEAPRTSGDLLPWVQERLRHAP